MTTPIALSIAGSDSSGGAGIQADLKTFSALGVYGATAIAALTAQNTLGVQAVLGIEPGFVRQQMDSVFADLRVDAVKIGMLGTREVIEAVAAGLDAWQPRYVVVDPVMVAKGGARLLDEAAIGAMRELLLPRATLLTPNLPEAAVLTGLVPPGDRDGMIVLGRRLQEAGAANVLVKGGHLEAPDAPDLLLMGGTHQWFEGQRLATAHTHGTGCSYAAAIAALLARGRPLEAAVAEAKAWLLAAIEAGMELGIGHGRGPVHHFHAWWPKT
ncbi:hydroxymethylpyrimidine kinase /phosphomethylpyrimidine kinase [Arboricoccus pini]|uniref:hydroxymethylpyrimidine kinase n=1 Tax=Arboricoccus pini TaxID=1963835 RepID=A0A212PZ69_9PROT|nr:bifunctional hydroxymethylpyrimidine kinase/phosphomethylpyrimidine kinase [Arboricoccus pini]SNB52356.1 hydroxymethylpyrimidine kinase /phosphomethylpyrimidine kinase [Arboricoccus pini]